MKTRSFFACASALTLVGLTGCAGGSLGTAGAPGAAAEDTVKVGLLVSLSGVYAAVGEEMEKGFELYLEKHDDKLGGRDVELVVLDEGSDPQSGVSAATRLIQQENVDVVVGVTAGTTAMGSRDLFDSSQVPVLISNGGSTPLGRELLSPWVFRTGFDAFDPGRALAAVKAAESDEDFFLIAADYSAGQEFMQGFSEVFPADRIAGEIYTPFGTTSDYSPYLARIRASGAENVFAFYAGAEAIAFVQQFDQFGLKETTTLYGAGYLTEGTALEAEGRAALDTHNVKRYNWDIDNAENTEFVAAYQEQNDVLPTIYSATAYDTGVMLDAAIATISGEVTRTGIRDAVAELEPVDGVRGALSIDDETNTAHVDDPFLLTQVRETPDGLRDVTVGRLEPPDGQ